MKKTNELGRSMVEMLGVLAIMGVIMYGAISGIGFGVDMYKINASYNDIEELSQGIIDLYSWSQDGYTAFTSALCDNDLIDAGCYTGGGCNSGAVCFDGRFGGNAYVVTAAGDHFTIGYAGLSELACTRLKSMSYSHVTVDSHCDGNGSNRYLTFTSR